MAKEKFDQPSLSVDGQLDLLNQRHLIVNEPLIAKHFLKTIGYYRLKSYFQPFLLNSKNFLMMVLNQAQHSNSPTACWRIRMEQCNNE